jgi:hypothetical protein
MEVLIIINIIVTVFSAYWLTEKNKAQATIITTLKTQLDTLNPFIDILKKFSDPKDVEKILDNKLKLFEQDTEIIRRQHIKQTSAYLKLEWAKRFEIEMKPLYGQAFTEFSNFAIVYFSNANFTDMIERNAHIKMYFPSSADHLINYLDEVINKPDAPPSNNS